MYVYDVCLCGSVCAFICVPMYVCMGIYVCACVSVSAKVHVLLCMNMCGQMCLCMLRKVDFHSNIFKISMENV